MSYHTNMCSSRSFLFITTVILQRYMVTMQPWGMFLPPNWSPYLLTHHGSLQAQPKIVEVSINIKTIPPHGMLLPPGGGVISH